MAEQQVKRHWTAAAVQPPALNNRQWWISGLIGSLFLLAALLQIISFNDFSENFAAMGLGRPNFWAAVLILAELWAAVGFFKIRLSLLFRKVSNVAAILAAGFWFYQSIKTVTEGNGDFTVSGQPGSIIANFFGRFLSQTPGWWSVIEASLFLLLVLWALEAFQTNSSRAMPVVIKKVNKRSKRGKS
jgi:hypothetical protein